METAVHHSASHQCIATVCIRLKSCEDVKYERGSYKLELLGRTVLVQELVDLPALL